MLSPPELPPPDVPLPRPPLRAVELPLRPRDAVERLAVFSLAAVEREAPDVLAFARVPVPLLLRAVEVDALRAPPLLLRLDEDRDELVDADPREPDDDPLPSSSDVHLPDSTR